MRYIPWVVYVPMAGSISYWCRCVICNMLLFQVSIHPGWHVRYHAMTISWYIIILRPYEVGGKYQTWIPERNSNFMWNFNLRFHMHIVCGYGQKPTDFQRCHFKKWPPGSHIGIFAIRTLTLVWLWISHSNFTSTLLVYMERNLSIFRDATAKTATWRPYWIFQFPDSTYSLALNIKYKLQ